MTIFSRLAPVLIFSVSALALFASGASQQGDTSTAPAGTTAAVDLQVNTERYELSAWEAQSGQKLVFKEAPEFATLVGAGSLAAVAERLPAEPMVVQPVEANGTYGGVWRRTNLGIIAISLYMDESLIEWDNTHAQLVPSVAKSWQVNADASSYTFSLRRGMKWSDGAPFTADDFMFAWNDVYLNKEITPTVSSIFVIGGEPGRIQKVDDYTVRYTFNGPHPLFLENLGDRKTQMWLPKHYLSDFHAGSAQQATLAAAVQEAGVSSWAELFNIKLDNGLGRTNIDRPTIKAWSIVDKITSPVQRHARNPYYWKIDTAGQQLPYFDRVDEYHVADGGAILLKALAGEIDYQGLRFTGLPNYPVLKQNATAQDYSLVPFPSPSTNLAAIHLNKFASDPVLRELFRTKDFRIALSHAIDRNEINQLLFSGLATPSQPAPPFPQWYNEQLATQYLAFDTAKANTILDGLGLEWDSAHQKRLRSDGQPLQLVLTVSTPWPGEAVDTAELVKGYWAKIGVEISVNPLETKLFNEKVAGADYDVEMNMQNLGTPGNPPALYLTAVPIGNGWNTWQDYAKWFNSDGVDGEEPPVDVKRLMALHDLYQAEPSAEKREDYNREVLQIHANNFWTIGVVNEPDLGRYFLIKNNIGNGVLGNDKAGFRFIGFSYPTNMAAFFYK